MASTAGKHCKWVLKLASLSATLYCYKELSCNYSTLRYKRCSSNTKQKLLQNDFCDGDLKSPKNIVFNL